MIVTAVAQAKAEINSSINVRWTNLPASLFSDDVTTEDVVCKLRNATLVVASGGVGAVAGVVALRTISRLGLLRRRDTSRISLRSTSLVAWKPRSAGVRRMVV